MMMVMVVMVSVVVAVVGNGRIEQKFRYDMIGRRQEEEEVEEDKMENVEGEENKK